MTGPRSEWPVPDTYGACLLLREWAGRIEYGPLAHCKWLGLIESGRGVSKLARMRGTRQGASRGGQEISLEGRAKSGTHGYASAGLGNVKQGGAQS